MMKLIKYCLFTWYVMLLIPASAQVRSIPYAGVTSYYIMPANESTRTPKLTEFLEVDYRMSVGSNDSLLNETFTLGKKAFLAVDHPSFKDIFLQVTPGDRIQITIKTDSFYKHTIRRPIPPFVKSGDSINFFMKVYDILDNEGLIRKQEAETNEKISNDSANLHYFLSTLFGVRETERGLYYIPNRLGTGKQPKSGDSVVVKYRAYFLDGEVFDKNMEEYRFMIGIGKVIPGIDEGVMMMREGGKFKFIIPYLLAYGSEGSNVVPPYTSIVFDVELITVIENFPLKQ
jgi:hypothetical protein